MVQLLVSVRSADEAASALAGGADIIDAKEPSRGSLGTVLPEVLTEILAAVPPDTGFSVALGDVVDVEQVDAAFDGLRMDDRFAPVYLKLGFARVDSASRVRVLIDKAARLARTVSHDVRIAPTAYADVERAETISPAALVQIAGQVHAAGVLLDTHVKDGKGLLHWFDPPALHGWVADAHRRGLIAALAGALEPADIGIVRGIAPDIMGVRGAACDGGRQGKVSAGRVRALQESLAGIGGPSRNA